MTLFGFYQVFGEGEYPGPAMLGMLIAAGIAIGARRLGLGTTVTVLASLAGLVLYLCFVFETRFTLFGLPTPDAVAALIRSLRHAAEKSSVDYAPVPVRTGYVVMVVVGMWAATTVGEIATFRLKRPLLASLPSIALFAVAMVLGTGQGAGLLVVLFLSALLTFWGLESALRIRSWGRWVPTFPGISAPEEEPSSITGSIARRMGAVTIAAAIVAPVLLPALDDGFLAWRTGVAGEARGGGGEAGSGLVDPFVSIAPRLLEQANTELFRVRAQRPSYWRLVTLGRFNGQSWNPIGVVDDPVADGRVGPGGGPSNGERAFSAEFRLTGLEGEYIPTAGRPQTVASDEEGFLERLRSAPGTGAVRLEDGIDPGLTYAVEAVLPDVSYADLATADPGETRVEYLQTPGISPPVRAFLTESISGIPDEERYRQLVAIQNRLRDTDEFSYSTDPATTVGLNGASADYLAEFLTRTKEGYCQQYATAFALLARQLKMPSRVVVGFLPGETVPAGPGEFIVRGTDAHAWPEVYFEGWGWIPFEPTPRSGAESNNRVTVVPSYTQPGATGGNTPTETGGLLGGDIDPRNQRPGFREALTAAARERAQAGLPGSRGAADGPRRDAPWKETFTRTALALAAATLLFFAAVPALKRWRVYRLYARARDARDRTAAAFEEFLLVAADLAAPKGPAESARSYVRRLASTRPLPGDRLARLATLYEASEFGRSHPDDAHAAEARALVREMKVRMWNAASWWNRLVRWFSPRGLGSARGPAPT